MKDKLVSAWNWTRDTLSRLFPSGKTYGIGIAIAIALVIVVAPEWVADRVQAVKTNLVWSPWGEEGLILLDTPQVYTRGRLVNDRARERTWLSSQLGKTDDYLRDSQFAKPAYVELVQKTLEVLGKIKQPEANNLPLPDLTQVLKPSPLEQFEDAILYREAIRNAVMSNELDDRHDIEGNTIYRLNFGATVTPQAGSTLLAAVVVELSEPDSTRLERGVSGRSGTHDRYVELMYDWSARLQDQLGQWIDANMNALTMQRGGSPEDDRMFGDWLLKSIAEATGNSADTTEVMLNKYFELYDAADIEFDQHNWRDRFIRKPTSNPDNNDERKFQNIAQQAILQCRANGRLDKAFLSDLQKRRILSKNVFAKDIECTRQGVVSGTGARLFQLVDVLDALRFLSTTSSGNVEDTFGRHNEWKNMKMCMEEPTSLAELLYSVIVRDAKYLKTSERVLHKDCFLKDATRQGLAPDQVQARRRMILAEFGVVKFQDIESKSHFASRDSKEANPKRLKDFFNFDIRASNFCRNLAPCNPIVKPNSRSFQSDSLQELIGLLDSRTEVFTYTVIPDKTLERRAVARELTSNLGMNWLGENLGLANKAATAGRAQRPSILGFGDWGRVASSPWWKTLFGKPPASKSATRFGWVMFPVATRDGTSLAHQKPEHYAVSALVSTPGWWKSVHLRVSTCWLSESELSKAETADAICKEPLFRSPPREFEIRLPGEVNAIMQKLRFDVVKYPYLSFPQAETIVEVGRRADIYIKGGRLWRSPIVKLGHQLSNEVEVLPDMDGIIARFTCVEPQPGMSGSSQQNGPEKSDGERTIQADQKKKKQDQEENEQKVSAPLIVQTSEGKTFPMDVVIRPFSPRALVVDDKPCWRPGKVMSQGKVDD